MSRLIFITSSLLIIATLSHLSDCAPEETLPGTDIKYDTTWKHKEPEAVAYTRYDPVLGKVVLVAKEFDNGLTLHQFDPEQKRVAVYTRPNTNENWRPAPDALAFSKLQIARK